MLKQTVQVKELTRDTHLGYIICDCCKVGVINQFFRVDVDRGLVFAALTKGPSIFMCTPKAWTWNEEVFVYSQSSAIFNTSNESSATL